MRCNPLCINIHNFKMKLNKIVDLRLEIDFFVSAGSP